MSSFNEKIASYPSEVLPLLKSLAPLILVAFLSRMDLDLPTSRLFFFVSQCAFVCLWAYILMAAGSNEDPRKVDCGEISKRRVYRKGDPPKGSRKIVSIAEYDQSQCWPRFRGVLMSLVFVAGIHLSYGHIIPLLIGPIMTWLELPSQKLVQLYILGSEDVGDLARPWKEETMFPKLAEALENQKKEKADKIKAQMTAARKNHNQPAGQTTEEIDMNERVRREKKRSKRLAKKAA